METEPAPAQPENTFPRGGLFFFLISGGFLAFVAVSLIFGLRFDIIFFVKTAICCIAFCGFIELLLWGLDQLDKPKQDAKPQQNVPVTNIPRWSQTRGNRVPTPFFSVVGGVILILVVGILASIFGPFMGGSTEQGKSSATKAAMQNLKAALINFNNDIGRFPFLGDIQTGESVNTAADALLGKTASDNILVYADAWKKTLSEHPMGLNPPAFVKRWKGPYVDSDPGDFMLDAWGTKITYLYNNKQIWLHSAGPDRSFDPIEKATMQDYQGDDIQTSVSRVTF
ncbi:MAG: hypothetical protein WA705_16635 [Candidatus Ozemobacteraceae bacterium]